MKHVITLEDNFNSEIATFNNKTLELRPELNGEVQLKIIEIDHQGNQLSSMISVDPNDLKRALEAIEIARDT